MPAAIVKVNLILDEGKKKALADGVSKALSSIIGKPTAYCAVVVEDGATINFAGSYDPAAFICVRSIGGLGSSTNNKLAAQFVALLKPLGIDGKRIYANFADIKASDWSMGDHTFG